MFAYIQMGFIYQLIIFIIQMGKTNTQLRPVTFSCSCRDVEAFPWAPLFSFIMRYFMPHAELDAGVTIMNKASSLPAGKLQKCRQSKEHERSATLLCVYGEPWKRKAVLAFTPAPSLSPASLPFSLMWVAEEQCPLLLIQAGGGWGSLTGPECQ